MSEMSNINVCDEKQKAVSSNTDNKEVTATTQPAPMPKPLAAPTAPSKHTAYATLRCLQQNAVEAVLELFSLFCQKQHHSQQNNQHRVLTKRCECV